MVLRAGGGAEGGLAQLAQIADCLADVPERPLVNPPGVQAVSARDRIIGGSAQLEQAAGDGAAPVELGGIGVRGPAREEEIRGFPFPAEPAGELLGPL